jgi:hypothetical protein
VDLDSNSVRIQRPHPGALSTGSTREKARKRLSDAIGNVSAYYTTPAEVSLSLSCLKFVADTISRLQLMEAFPAGRFRPFSDVSSIQMDRIRLLILLLQVEVDGLPKEAERLRPAASWDVRAVPVWRSTQVLRLYPWHSGIKTEHCSSSTPS